MQGSLIDAGFKRNVLFSYGAQAAVAGFGFISVTIVTRYAGIDMYGKLAIISALASTLTNLMTFRTNEAVIRFYKRGRIQGDLGQCRLSLVAGLTLDALTGGVLLILIQYFSSSVSDILLKQPGLESGITLFSYTILSTFLRSTALGLLAAEERFRLINIINVTEMALKALLLSLAVYTGTKLGFEEIIWASLAPSLLVTGTAYTYPIIKLSTDLRKERSAGKYTMEYLRFSLSTFFSSSLKAGNQNIDSIILGYLTNPSSVGVYHIFKQFLSPLSMLTGPFTSQIYPRFVKAVAAKQHEIVLSSIKHGNRILTTGFFLVLLVLTPGLVVYDKWNNLQLIDAQYIAFYLMATSAFISQMQWWSRPFSLATNPNTSLRAGLLSTICICVLLPAFILMFDFIGIATCHLFSQILLTMFWRRELKRST